MKINIYNNCFLSNKVLGSQIMQFDPVSLLFNLKKNALSENPPFSQYISSEYHKNNPLTSQSVTERPASGYSSEEKKTKDDYYTEIYKEQQEHYSETEINNKQDIHVTGPEKTEEVSYNSAGKDHKVEKHTESDTIESENKKWESEKSDENINSVEKNSIPTHSKEKAKMVSGDSGTSEIKKELHQQSASKHIITENGKTVESKEVKEKTAETGRKKLELSNSDAKKSGNSPIKEKHATRYNKAVTSAERHKLLASKNSQRIHIKNRDETENGVKPSDSSNTGKTNSQMKNIPIRFNGESLNLNENIKIKRIEVVKVHEESSENSPQKNTDELLKQFSGNNMLRSLSQLQLKTKGTFHGGNDVSKEIPATHTQAKNFNLSLHNTFTEANNKDTNDLFSNKSNEKSNMLAQKKVNPLRKSMSSHSDLTGKDNNPGKGIKNSMPGFQNLSQKSINLSSAKSGRIHSAHNFHLQRILFVRDIIGRIQSLIKDATLQKRDFMSMNFETKNFGQMNLSLHQKGDILDVALEVTSENTRHNLMNYKDDLIQVLKNMGYKQISMDINTQDHRDNQNRQHEYFRKNNSNENPENVKLAGSDIWDMSRILSDFRIVS